MIENDNQYQIGQEETEMGRKIHATVLAAGIMMALTMGGEAFAAHPLITDDAGTQGKGKTQLEFIGEYGTDKEEGATEKGFEAPTVPFLSYGMSDTMDLVFGLPSGDEEKGLGNGKPSYGAFLITTKEAGPWAFHFNVGYVRNEYKLQADEDANRKDIWQIGRAHV